MTKHKPFMVDEISCDWISLTSFDSRNRRRWETVMNGAFRVMGYDAKQAMYTGIIYESGFLGQAEQKGMIHTLCKATGGGANEVLYRLIRATAGKFRSTRIDIQLTVVLPSFHNARRLKDKLEVSQRLSTRLIENGGMDTVYVGSRQSAMMWRIYVKQDADENMYLRFEIEVKNGKDGVADRLARHISANGHEAMVQWFFEKIDRLNLPEEYVYLLNDYRGGDATRPLPKEVRDSGGKTFRWLDGIVRKSIVRYACESHGRADFMCGWLFKINEEIQASMGGHEEK